MNIAEALEGLTGYITLLYDMDIFTEEEYKELFAIEEAIYDFTEGVLNT